MEAEKMIRVILGKIEILEKDDKIEVKEAIKMINDFSHDPKTKLVDIQYLLNRIHEDICVEWW